jgi:hypothetical protein
MLNKLARITLVVLIPITALGTPKGKETIQLQVVSSRTRIHGAAPDVFSYTDLMFTRINGKNVVYECSQRGDECPLVEDGKTYSADRMGNVIFISMTSPEGNRSLRVKYKEVGSW